MYRLHTQCRACGYAKPPYPGKSAPSGEKLIKVFDLGLQPLANDFTEPNSERAGFAPLEVMYCPRCTLGQLSVTVSPAVLYAKYAYVTSQSQTMQEHFHALWDYLNGLCTPLKVVEIGSNDGLFLSYAREHGADHVQGVDPAINLSKLANERGVHTLNSMLDGETARQLEATFPEPDLVVARHVFCHIDNWHDFIHHLAVFCTPRTIVYIEVPYAGDLVDRGEFDTVYHEHTSYLTIRAVDALLSDSPFSLWNVARWTIHGGAIGLVLKMGKPTGEALHVQVLRDQEEKMKDRWDLLAVKAHAKIGAVQALVDVAHANGKRVVGYGASAKSTVWVNACEFKRRHIEFITDNTPFKQWKVSPGTDIPIVDEGALTRELPDYAICFAWNYASEIIQKEKLFQQKGGKWIIPNAEVQVL